MAMISMKCDGDDAAVMSSKNEYGYGLRIRLNEDQCEALGIKTPPAAGSKLTIKAAAFVASATQSVEADGDDAGPDIYLEMQITDMEIGGASDNAAASSMLYGS